jgi:membrane protease YdiL (CAAX protease family)
MVPVFKKGRKVNNYDLFANHAWYVPGVKGMFGLLGWFLLGTLLGVLVVGLFGVFVPKEIINQYCDLIMYPLSFLPAMVYAAQKSQKNSLFEPGYKLNSSHFGPFKGWQLALVTVALTYATMVVADLPNYWNFKLTTAVPWMKSFYDLINEILQQMMKGPLWSSFLLLAIFAPVFEEWLCRGMVLRGLLARMKPVWAIVVSALFFALIHMNPWQALNAFILGLVMGYVYYKTGSLLLTMLIHFVNNGTAVILSQFSSLQETEFWIEMMPMPVFIGLYVVGLLVLAACLLVFRRIPLEQERGNIDSVELNID